MDHRTKFHQFFENEKSLMANFLGLFSLQNQKEDKYKTKFF